MDNNTLKHIDKAVFILLVIVAAIIIIISMVAGPFGKETAANALAVSAILISLMVLWRTIRAMRSPNSKK